MSLRFVLMVYAESFNHDSVNRRMVLFMSILTWILSVVAVADCTFIRAGLRDDQYKNLLEFGLFNANVDTSGGHRCLRYESTVQHDAASRTGQAFACMAALFSGFAMLKVIALQFSLRWKPSSVWRLVRVNVLAAAISQSIVFAVFATDACVEDANIKCLPGPAGIINAINVLLLGILSWFCCGMSPPDPVFDLVKHKPAEGSDRPEEGASSPVSSTDVPPTQSSVDVPKSGDELDPEFNGYRYTFSGERNAVSNQGMDKNFASNEPQVIMPSRPGPDLVDTKDNIDQYLTRQYCDYNDKEDVGAGQPMERDERPQHHHKKHRHHTHPHSSRRS